MDHSYISLHVACRLRKAKAENHSKKSWRHSCVDKIASKVLCELLHVFFIHGPQVGGDLGQLTRLAL